MSIDLDFTYVPARYRRAVQWLHAKLTAWARETETAAGVEKEDCLFWRVDAAYWQRNRYDYLCGLTATLYRIAYTGAKAEDTGERREQKAYKRARLMLVRYYLCESPFFGKYAPGYVLENLPGKPYCGRYTERHKTLDPAAVQGRQFTELAYAVSNSHYRSGCYTWLIWKPLSRWTGTAEIQEERPCYWLAWWPNGDGRLACGRTPGEAVKSCIRAGRSNWTYWQKVKHKDFSESEWERMGTWQLKQVAAAHGLYAKRSKAQIRAELKGNQLSLLALIVEHE